MLGVENGLGVTARAVRVIHYELFDLITYSVGAKKKFLLDDKNGALLINVTYKSNIWAFKVICEQENFDNNQKYFRPLWLNLIICGGLMPKPKKQEYNDGDTITCPNCGEETLEYNKKEDIWRCSLSNCRYAEKR